MDIRVGMVPVCIVSIVFDNLHILHIFISQLLDYLLPIKNGYIMGGGGGAVPWGRRQKCQMQNTIFDLPPNSFYSFFSGRGRMPIYPGDRNRRIGRKNVNDNPVRKWYICSSYHCLNLWVFHDIRSSFRVQTCIWRNWNNPAKRLFLCCCFPGKYRE